METKSHLAELHSLHLRHIKDSFSNPMLISIYMYNSILYTGSDVAAATRYTIVMFRTLFSAARSDAGAGASRAS